MLILTLNKNCLLFSTIVWLFINDVNSIANLSCYQCVRTSNVECEPSELLACDPKWDRCVTHIMKDDEDGFKIERQCGVGPCTFDDLMNKPDLGIGPNSCDRSRQIYFCLFCCRDSGCNKNHSSRRIPPGTTLVLLLAALSFGL